MLIFKVATVAMAPRLLRRVLTAVDGRERRFAIVGWPRAPRTCYASVPSQSSPIPMWDGSGLTMRAILLHPLSRWLAFILLTLILLIAI